ncbi:MAG: glutamine-synthetase adenylyltransferase, partial [Pseudomonadota bacterium]
MSLTTLTRQAPLTRDPARGEDCAALYPDAAPSVVALIRGAGGTSSYLSGLLRREADWLRPRLDMPLGQALREVRVGEDLSPAALAPALRTAKRRAALLLALADLGGAMEMAEVTRALTEFADWAVGCAAAA